jgi:hypothetical protein
MKYCGKNESGKKIGRRKKRTVQTKRNKKAGTSDRNRLKKRRKDRQTVRRIGLSNV